MTPELRQRVGELFDAALSVESSLRAQYLTQACADDPPIVRAEVESLLTHFECAAEAGFLKEPAAGTDWNHDTLVGEGSVPEELTRAPAGYEILGQLGAGGMGVVYLAFDRSLKRQVALKMIRGGNAGASELARVRAEAEAVARLQHPNIVQVFEIDEHDGQPYCALEYVPGGNLDDFVAALLSKE